MNTSPDNPYEPPTVINEQPVKSRGSLAICLVSTVVTAAFMAFTIRLLRYGGNDGRVGVAFTCTAILLICLTFSVYRSTRRGFAFGAAASAVQTLNMVAIQLAIGGRNNRSILEYSAYTILPIVVITVWSWRHSRENA